MDRLPLLHSMRIAIVDSRCICFWCVVVAGGFDDDWQLLVELQIEIDQIDGVRPPPPEHMRPPE